MPAGVSQLIEAAQLPRRAPEPIDLVVSFDDRSLGDELGKLIDPLNQSLQAFEFWRLADLKRLNFLSKSHLDASLGVSLG